MPVVVIGTGGSRQKFRNSGYRELQSISLGNNMWITEMEKPRSVNNLDLVNHMRLVSLGQFHGQLDNYMQNAPEKYNIIKDFILELQPEHKFTTKKET